MPLQSLSLPSQVSALGCTFWLQTMAPFVHAVVPGWHTPWRFVLHARPPPGLPSSTVPLQLLSMPSQTSPVGETFWLQTTAPLTQAVVPAAQAPSLSVVQARPPPGLPSSTAPLQSLSLPSQVSALGCTFWLQTMPPFEHAVVPAEQTPSLPVLQAWPPPGFPSSAMPLQSLSLPSQVSALGCVFCTHWIEPPTQCCVPGAQTPCWPVAQVPPPPGSPSSMAPLQLLSMPSQTSTCCGSGLHTLGSPFLQKGTVLRHAPMPQVTVPRPSSTSPLQSLSLPSQTSVEGRPGVQVCGRPPSQLAVTRWHSPVPHTEVPRPSSTVPSQSSSLALHVSTPGRIWFSHGPH